MNAKNIAWLATGLLFCPMLLTNSANAQWDPESGDTGEWTAPPETAETPPTTPPEQQPPTEQEADPAQPAGWTPPPAQQPAQQPSWFAGQEQGETPTDRPPAMGGTEQGGQATTPAGTTDHSQVSFGVTFFGLDSLTIQPNGVASRDERLSLDMPVVGVRYWLSESLGLDIGLGIGLVSSSDNVDCAPTCGESTKVDGTDGGFGIRLHFGLPVVLKSFEHFNVLLTPELGFAYGAATIFAPGSATEAEFDIELSGIAFDLAVKIGGELQFGFWGVPNLAIQGNIGLGLRYSSQSAANSRPEGSGALDLNSSGFSVRTIANDLAGSVRILYYF